METKNLFTGDVFIENQPTIDTNVNKKHRFTGYVFMRNRPGNGNSRNNFCFLFV